jgi:adenine-specific DNA-methyltransferase
MANITKQKREQMLAFLEDLKKEHSDDDSIRAFNEIENHLKDKKFGLVFEEHTEAVDDMLKEYIPVFCADGSKRICKDKERAWNFIIEGDNLQALYLLEKTHRGKISCIYIDPPYNTGARDWKYNNDYVDGNDVYRHSKWLSMMKTRLLMAKRLLNPDDSVLICTIDEKEYLHLGCLLEELFPEANMQMISSVINPSGVAREGDFYRTDEYIYILRFGKSVPKKLPLSEEWLTAKSSGKDSARWRPIRRQGSHDTRADAPNQFYPIYLSEDGSHVIGTGDSLPVELHADDILQQQGCITIWPLKPNGEEGCWQISQDSIKTLLDKGYIKVTYSKKWGYVAQYLAEGERQKVESGLFKVLGKDKYGTVILSDAQDEGAPFIPGTQWRISSHSAREQGASLLKRVFDTKIFSFPKSLYAVHDVIRFFVEDKPDAIILDFFAGSGTTMHAVNLLNAELGGNRHTILVTNNEISEEEQKEFEKRNIHKGDAEWEAKGIAQAVTWPRIKCFIEGTDIKGKPIKGTYLGSDIPMSDGFVENVKYFKCDWTPRKPEDYLLSNALCLHIKEMIELQNAIEIDGVKNIILLNKDDIKKNILDPVMFKKAENIWLNQNIILNADEMKLLKNKGFKYIPREFFGQELKEVAE